MSSRFAVNLRQLREKACLSQEELGFRAMLHRTQVSLLEGGERLPRFETLVKLAGALEVSISELAKGIAWEPILSTSGGLKVDLASPSEAHQ